METKTKLFVLSQTQKCYSITIKGEDYSVSFDDYMHPIGAGTFGKVYRATTRDKSPCALKIISKNGLLPRKKILKEIEILKAMTAQPLNFNLLTIISSIEDSENFYIFTPLMEQGMLTTIINRGEITKEADAIEYFRQICYGLQILHSKKYLHRDLKTDNVFADLNHDPSYPYKYYLVLADYGLSRKQGLYLTMQVGTCTTSSPEVDNGDDYDSKADIYSAGCVLYKMLSGKEPFPGKTDLEIMNKKKAESINIECSYPLSETTMKILNGCLKYDKNHRLSAEELYSILKVNNLYAKYESIKLVEQSKSNKIYLKYRIEQDKVIKNVPEISINDEINLPQCSGDIGLNTRASILVCPKQPDEAVNSNKIAILSSENVNLKQQVMKIDVYSKEIEEKLKSCQQQLEHAQKEIEVKTLLNNELMKQLDELKTKSKAPIKEEAARLRPSKAKAKDSCSPIAIRELNTRKRCYSQIKK